MRLTDEINDSLQEITMEGERVRTATARGTWAACLRCAYA
jgi:hypothetical protein